MVGEGPRSLGGGGSAHSPPKPPGRYQLVLILSLLQAASSYSAAMKRFSSLRLHHSCPGSGHWPPFVSWATSMEDREALCQIHPEGLRVEKGVWWWGRNFPSIFTHCPPTASLALFEMGRPGGGVCLGDSGPLLSSPCSVNIGMALGVCSSVAAISMPEEKRDRLGKVFRSHSDHLATPVPSAEPLPVCSLRPTPGACLGHTHPTHLAPPCPNPGDFQKFPHT